MSSLTTPATRRYAPRHPGTVDSVTDSTHRIVCLEQGGVSTWAAWDEFVVACPRGQMAQLSTWLQSFAPYGGETTILAAVCPLRQRILGGIGMVHFGRWFGGWFNAPSGPIVAHGHDHLTAPLIQAAVEHARRHGAWALQVQPASARDEFEMLMHQALPEIAPWWRAGCGVDFGLGTRTMKWLAFPQTDDESNWREQLLAGFNSGTRRNIRQAEREQVEVREATWGESLREAYSIIERNGQEQGYATRSWHDFQATLVQQQRRGQAHVLTAWHQGELLGAHYSLIAGGRLTYVMAGTVRRQPDMKIGHLLHWEAMRMARRLGLSGYDFSSGGSAGVLRFKRGFRPLEIDFAPPCQYVLAPLRWAALCRLLRGAQRDKAFLAKLARIVRGPVPVGEGDSC